jgi:hypothetical protein
MIAEQAGRTGRSGAQPDPLPDEVAVPEQVIVSMAEIAGAAKVCWPRP